jgi:hypothetical protein
VECAKVRPVAVRQALWWYHEAVRSAHLSASGGR